MVHGLGVNGRVASVLLITGSILGLIGTLLHPYDGAEREESIRGLLEVSAATPYWTPLHIVLVLGVGLVVAGLVVFRGSFSDPAAVAYGRAGVVFVIMGGIMLITGFGVLDGYAIHALATEWQSASGEDQARILVAAEAVHAIEFGVLWVAPVLLGIGVGAFGLAMLASRIVSVWLGWAGVIVGLITFVIGLVLAVLGPTTLTLDILFRAFGVIQTIYTIALGLALHRLARGSDAARVAAEPDSALPR